MCLTPWGLGVVKVRVSARGCVGFVCLSQPLACHCHIHHHVRLLSASMLKGCSPESPWHACAAAKVQPPSVLPAGQTPDTSTAGWTQRSVKFWAKVYSVDYRSATETFVTAPTRRAELSYGCSAGPGARFLQ